MKIFETEGLLLKTFPLMESDKIVSCLTKEHGLVKFVARGSRKLKSKFAGRLEPFTIVSLQFRQKEDAELAILQQVELKRSFFHLAGHLRLISTLGYFSELLMEFAPPNESNEKLYRLAISTFETVGVNSDETESLSLAALYFELWLLRLTGFLPDINRCGECRAQLSSESGIFWSHGNRFLCRNCSDRAGVSLSKKQISVLRSLQRMSPDEFIKTRSLAPEDFWGLRQIARKLIKQVVLRDFEYWSEKSWVSVG